MKVTINTDASFNHHENVGAYAFWISSDFGRIRRSGALKNVSNNVDCEDMAIAKALAFLNNWRGEFEITQIFINTDSQSSIRRIKSKHISRVAIPHILRYINLMKPKGVSRFSGKKAFVKLRHVKAHTHTNTARNYVNDWCDKAAKTEMRNQLTTTQ